jgi:hypothetical protein
MNYMNEIKEINDAVASLKADFATMTTTDLVLELHHYENAMNNCSSRDFDGLVGMVDMLVAEINSRRVTISEIN